MAARPELILLRVLARLVLVDKCEIRSHSSLSRLSHLHRSHQVIVATDIAESSLTIADVDLVIDCGTRKAIIAHDSIAGVQLVSRWISRTAADQRAGRAGRVRPGRAYRLYPVELYEKLMVQHEPAQLQVGLGLDVGEASLPPVPGRAARETDGAA